MPLAELSRQIMRMEDRISNLERHLLSLPSSFGDGWRTVISDLRASLEELEITEIETQARSGAPAESQGKLSSARQRYFNLFEHTPNAYLVTSEQGVILEANLPAGRMLGIHKDYLRGVPLAELVMKEDHQKFRKEMTEVSRSNVREFTLRLRKGTEQELNVSIRVVTGGEQGTDPTLFLWLRDITGCSQAEEALRESEERYRAFIENSSEAIWCYEAGPGLSTELSEDEQIEHIYEHGCLAECNDAMARMYGFARAEELVGSSLGDVMPRSDPRNIAYLKRFIRSGYRLSDAESYELGHEGRPLTFLNNLMGIIKDGFIIRIWGTQRDVTEQKGAEERLRRAEEKYRDIFENAISGIFQSTPEGRFVSVNPALARMYGYASAKEMIAERTDIELQHYVEPTRRAEFMKLLEKRDAMQGFESEVYRKDGSRFWTSESVRAVRDDTGALLYYEGFVEDITERKRADEALKQSEADYRGLFEQAHDAIIVLSEENEVVLDVNDRACQIYGFSRSEFIGMSVEAISKNVERGRAKIKETLEKGEYLNFETVQYRKNGEEIVLEINAAAIDYQGARAILSINRDITERKRGEEMQARRARQAALRADVSGALAGRGTLPKTLERCSQAIVRHLDAAFARIWTFDKAGGVLELQASSGMYTHTDGAHALIPIGELKIGRIAAKRRPYLTNDIHNDPAISDPEWARREGMVSFAGHPLVVDDKLVGVMAMFARHPLADDTLDALGSVADALAQGIERRRAEQALRDSEERNRVILKAIPDLMFLQTRDGVYLDYHAKDLNSLLVPPEKFIGRNMKDVLPPRLAEKLILCFECAAESDETQVCEYAVEIGGELRHYEARLAHCNGDILSIIRDVTERRQAEERLKEGESQLRLFTELIPQQVWSCEPDGSCDFCNQRWLEYTGLTMEQARGSGWASVVHPDDLDKVLKEYREVINTGRTYEIEHRLRGADGEYHWFLARAVPQRDQEGNTIKWYGTNTDIQDRKQAEAERVALLRRLVNAQEEERHRIARELHDEIGQYLAALMLGLRAITRIPDLSPRLGAQLKYLSELTETFGQEARRFAFDLRPVALNELGLASTLANYVRDWGQRHGNKVVADFYSSGFDGPGERLAPEAETALYRLVQEALTNVLKHAEAQHVGVILEGRPGEVRLIIEDDGVGFDVAAILDGPASERGLGIRGMRERVSILGGTLEVESGAGTTVVVKLPFSPRTTAHNPTTEDGDE